MDHKELIELSKKAAAEWQNTHEYYQAAILVTALCEATETLLAERDAAGWISVKDRLPVLKKEVCDGVEVFVSEDVLAFHVDEYGENRQIVACFERDDTGYLFTGWSESSEGMQLHSVTHWMPLPTPP